MKKIIFLATIISFFVTPQYCFAWGARGHRLVATIAFHFLDDSTKQKVQQYLGKMSFEEAGTWMDDNRPNSYYDFMRTWHYVDMEKGMTLQSAPEKNLITILNAAIYQLEKNKDNLNNKEIRNDLLFIFHLTGDLHQPLHCGYPDDKGGNTINVVADGFANNLHSVWDSEIIEDKDITFYDCLKYYDSLSEKEIKAIEKINLVQWMNQSRSLLDTVYDYKNDFLDSNYVNRSAIIIEKQLLYGGMRLASILKEVMKNYPLKNTLTPVEGLSTETKEIKTVAIKDLGNYEGETVKVCAKIISGKYESALKHHITVLDAKSNETNDELTILILEKDRYNFKGAPEKFYKDKNICITGRVETFDGKPSIILKNETQILIQ